MDIVKRINELKKERNAVILVHNYQLPEVQDIGDFIGDSLALSYEASRSDADVIVFCGVYFMAETAKIISPDKTVLIPDPTAGCPMADMVTVEDMVKLKDEHPDALILTYINSNADVKAYTDICCTSGNAEKVLSKIDKDRKVIFLPDFNLSDHIATKLHREVIKWDGFCPTHARMGAEDVKRARELHSEALLLAHPECEKDVRDLADHICSTEEMCRLVKTSDRGEFIIGTEVGIIHRLQKENPGKKFYPLLDEAVCPNMKKTTLEKVLHSLETMAHEVIVPEDVAQKARKSIERMLEYR